MLARGNVGDIDSMPPTAQIRIRPSTFANKCENHFLRSPSRELET
jgi:hypothetical protein